MTIMKERSSDPLASVCFVAERYGLHVNRDEK